MPEHTTNGILEQLGAEELIRLVNSLPLRASIILKLYAIEGYSHKKLQKSLKFLKEHQNLNYLEHEIYYAKKSVQF